jgi:hypothetical protein
MAALVVSAKADRACVEVVPRRNACHGLFIQRRILSLAAFCLLMLSFLPLDAVAQITQSLRPSLLPYPVTSSTPQEQPGEFAPLGLRMGDFSWYPRGELDQAYNNNIFATATSLTGDSISALTTSFDLLSNFSQNSLNLHAGSLAQIYAGHPAQNTQDGVISTDGTLNVTAGSFLYGTAYVAHQHIAYGSPNSPGAIAEPVTYWTYNADAGYYAGGRRLTYGVDFGVSAAQYNAAQLVGGGVLPQSSQNAISYSAAVRAGYEIIPDYVGYIRVGGSLFDYLRVPGGVTNPNFSTYQIDLGLQILPNNHIIYGDAYVGYLIQNFAQSSLGSTSTPDFGGDLTWSITPLTTLIFSGLTTFYTGTPGTSIPTAGNSYLYRSLSVSVNHQLLPNLQLSLIGSYINNTFQGISRAADNIFLVNASVRYQVNRNLYLGGDVFFAEQTGSFSFSQNIFTIRVGTQF